MEGGYLKEIEILRNTNLGQFLESNGTYTPHIMGNLKHEIIKEFSDTTNKKNIYWYDNQAKNFTKGKQLTPDVYALFDAVILSGIDEFYHIMMGKQICKYGGPTTILPELELGNRKNILQDTDFYDDLIISKCQVKGLEISLHAGSLVGPPRLI